MFKNNKNLFGKQMFMNFVSKSLFPCFHAHSLLSMELDYLIYVVSGMYVNKNIFLRMIGPIKHNMLYT